MRLIIVRHGKARADSPDGSDFSRDLRGRGERQAAFVGERLASAPGGVGRIVSSEAVRARRTAEIIAAAVGARVEHDDALLVDEPAGPVVDRLEAWGEGLEGESALVLVGHNPQLERLAAVLGTPAALRGAFGGAPLRTGEAVVLEIDPAAPIGGSLSGTEIERIRLEEA
jgi:phosphohistidine phosphatase